MTTNESGDDAVKLCSGERESTVDVITKVIQQLSVGLQDQIAPIERRVYEA